MKMFKVPARYAPELEGALASAVRNIEADMKMIDLGGDPDKHYVDVDESRTGDLVVLVGVSLAVEGQL